MNRCQKGDIFVINDYHYYSYSSTIHYITIIDDIAKKAVSSVAEQQPGSYADGAVYSNFTQMIPTTMTDDFNVFIL